MIEEWFYDIPIVTRTYISAIFLTTLACKLEFVSPLQLFFGWDLVWRKGQYWRLITTFLFFGHFSFDFLFHVFFLSRYSRMLEEGSFRGNSIDYLWMLVLGMISILCIAPIMTFLIGTSISFHANSLTFMLIYIWSRRNPNARMNFLGVFNFNAPYLPFVLFAFPIVLNGDIPWHDVPGLVIGHIYYFFEDVYPRLNGSRGVRYFKTPAFFSALFMQRNFSFGGALPVRPDMPRPVPGPIPQEALDSTPAPSNDTNVPLDDGWKDMAQEIKEDNQETEIQQPGGYSWGKGHALGSASVRKRNTNDFE